MKKFLAFVFVLSACVTATACSSARSSVESDLETQISVDDETAQAADPDNRFAAYDFTAVSDPIEYNPAPECASWPIPSRYETADYSPIRSTENMVQYSTDLAVVRILDEPNDETAYLTGSEELDKELAGKYKVDSLNATVLLYPAKVLYTAVGDVEQGENIVVMQVAGNWGVELKKDKEYFIAFKAMNDGTYKPSLGINSVYEINDDFTVQPESMFEIGARYEGLPLADLVSDFTQAFEQVQEKKREMVEQGNVWWSE